jgi:hypothetical protein
MLNFNKKKKEYEILKFYKIVDLDAAKNFRTKFFLKLIFDFFETFYNNLPDNFDLNYGKKEWRSFNKFDKNLVKYTDNSICYLNCYFSSSRSRFSFSNDMRTLILILKKKLKSHFSVYLPRPL